MLNGCFKGYIVSQYMDHMVLYVMGTSLDTMILQMRLDSCDHYPYCRAWFCYCFFTPSQCWFIHSNCTKLWCDIAK